MSKRLLVVEDDRDIADLVALNLRDLGYQVDVALDGRGGLEKVSAHNYDLVVLDLMLPGLDGLEVCKRLRGGQNYVPILMLTARSSELDRVLSLEIGADDYMTKPFSIRELQARAKALLRRMEVLTSPEPAQQTLRVGELEIELDKRRVSSAGKPLSLTAKEFDLLVLPSGAGLGLGLAALAALFAHHPLKLWLADLRRGKRFPRTALAGRFALLYLLLRLLGLVLAMRSLGAIYYARTQVLRTRGHAVSSQPAHRFLTLAVAVLALAAVQNWVPWLSVLALGGLLLFARWTLARPSVQARVVGWTQMGFGLLIVLATALGIRLGL
ncbi:MAG: hypothetical protein C4332_02580 [Meiothermus sp.]